MLGVQPGSRRSFCDCWLIFQLLFVLFSSLFLTNLLCCIYCLRMIVHEMFSRSSDKVIDGRSCLNPEQVGGPIVTSTNFSPEASTSNTFGTGKGRE